jgi:cation diffusion facilitator CzcD-associated flavoprotein CzcO
LELPIWLSANASHAEFDEHSGLWNVKVERKDHPDRLFKVKHFVLATGILGNQPKMPNFPGRELFGGKILHSLDHKTASGYEGKKVAVVGACTSG